MLPAYAGMIPGRRPGAVHALRAPRVCGDDPPIGRITEMRDAVLPAYAGMIPEPDEAPVPEESAPRVCGDDPCDSPRASVLSVCSPRMRG